MFQWLRKLFSTSPEGPVDCERPICRVNIEVAERLIGSFLAAQSDQKLHDVYAFCEDGKMDYDDPCQCILGVFSSECLHMDVICDSEHYYAIRELPGLGSVEVAYFDLGYDDSVDLQSVRDQRFLKLLRAEIDRRDAARELGKFTTTSTTESPAVPVS